MRPISRNRRHNRQEKSGGGNRRRRGSARRWSSTVSSTTATGTDPSQCAVRFGYWGTHTSGSPVKVGEYQDLGASPFYDIDGLRSDGRRTLNYTITGTDAETNAANLNYYRPGVEANVNYQRFPHNLGHENLGEFPDYTDRSP